MAPLRGIILGCVLALTVYEPIAAAPAVLRVGSLELTPCKAALAYCGEFERPLDPTGAIAGQISIHFEYYRHTGRGAAIGTLVATEGGPGFPATLSRDDYLALFAPLRLERDVLLMDNRGTGQSAAIDCHALQTAKNWTVELMGDCGRSLGASAPLYSTAYAADDLAAILATLGITHIDLYGDSYGTYFEQVFALRHPKLLRSLVLDGAYPLTGPDYAWYPTYAPAMRDKFNIACRRFTPCAALPGSSIEHLQPLLDELRKHPFAAAAPDGDGRTRQFTADAAHLAIVMFGSAPALTSVRELDAAARAYLAGDRPPLLRLLAETIADVDSRDPTADATQWSAGLAAAVNCQDPPQIFDMRLTPELRIVDRDRAIAARKATFPDTYAPFTIDEYRGMPIDYSFIDQCVDWPVASWAPPPAVVVPAGARYPDVPALVISGELDNLTTPADGAAVARAFAHGRQVIVANSFHVNALPRARSACAAQIVRRFIDTLKVVDTRCAAHVPPLRLVPQFAERSADLESAVATAGNAAGAEQLREVAAAVMTVGDVLDRLESNTSGSGVGLRGGQFHVVNGTPVRIYLEHVRWTDDVDVSGEIDKPNERDGMIQAHLRLSAALASSTANVTASLSAPTVGAIRVEWRVCDPAGIAKIRGSLGGLSVSAATSAP